MGNEDVEFNTPNEKESKKIETEANTIDKKVKEKPRRRSNRKRSIPSFYFDEQSQQAFDRRIAIQEKREKWKNSIKNRNKTSNKQIKQKSQIKISKKKIVRKKKSRKKIVRKKKI